MRRRASPPPGPQSRRDLGWGGIWSSLLLNPAAAPLPAHPRAAAVARPADRLAPTRAEQISSGKMSRIRRRGSPSRCRCRPQPLPRAPGRSCSSRRRARGCREEAGRWSSAAVQSSTTILRPPRALKERGGGEEMSPAEGAEEGLGRRQSQLGRKVQRRDRVGGDWERREGKKSV
jgi:hypothetical protein